MHGQSDERDQLLLLLYTTRNLGCLSGRDLGPEASGDSRNQVTGRISVRAGTVICATERMLHGPLYS